MRDKPSETDRGPGYVIHWDRCGVCYCIPIAAHRVALNANCYVTTCGSHYCNARARETLDSLRVIEIDAAPKLDRVWRKSTN